MGSPIKLILRKLSISLVSILVHITAIPSQTMATVASLIQDLRTDWKRRKSTTDWETIEKECTILIEKYGEKPSPLSSPHMYYVEYSPRKCAPKYNHRQWFDSAVRTGSSKENTVLCKFFYNKLICEPIVEYYQTQLNKHFDNDDKNASYRPPLEIMGLIISFIPRAHKSLLPSRNKHAKQGP